MRRVVMTGLGIVGPTGAGWEPFWDAINTGRSGIGPITRFDASTFPCTVGGQIPDDGCLDGVDARKERTSSHSTRLALAASDFALRDARLGSTQYDPAAFGTFVGTALGGWVDAEKQCAVLFERGARRVNPFMVSGAGNHGAGVEVAAAVRAEGAQVTISSGCPSSVQAIGQAAAMIASGTLDVCLAGGTESPLSPLLFSALCRTQELSTRAGSDASRPFDRGHVGMVLSEGSALIVLESAGDAAARGAPILAEVLGSATSCDAQGMYGADPTGASGARAIHRLLRQADLTPNDIDYICAHANSSAAFDRKEAAVLTAALGEFAARIPTSSIKGIIGHPFGASGAFQAAAAALAIRNGQIPPTHHLDDPDPDCALNHVRREPLSTPVRRALVTSYGYGGVNAYLLLGAYAD